MIEVLRSIESKINVNLIDTLTEVQRFYQFSLNNIFGFYVNRNNNIIDEYRELIDLIQSLKSIIKTISINKIKFDNYAYWDVLDQIEDVKNKLITIQNTHKWMRSNIGIAGTSNYSIDHVMIQNQTLEDVGFIYNIDPVELALENNLLETSYNLENNPLLSVTLTKNIISSQITNMVGVIKGKSVYGIDLTKSIQFIESDLVTLDNEKTLFQTVNNLLTIKRGDNPYYPNDGVSVQIGSNINLSSILFPSMFREILNVFEKDDSIKSLSLISAQSEQDSVKYEFEIVSILNEVVSNNINA